MLRALIHDVLLQYPELIPAVFPDLYQNWKASDADIEPSYVEVKKAFELMLQKSSAFLKLCIFIDGIDEFDGDHKDVSEFLRSLAKSRRVKIVLSSRPITASLNTFRGCPTLRLQDLTIRDMATYVRGTLESHRSMVELSKHFPHETTEVCKEIREKADGVFLWVKLVVRILVDGLENGDDLKDLQLKLRKLPPDLRDLYRRMLGKMEPDHQRQSAEIFQLFHHWNLAVPDQAMRTIVMSFAMQDPALAFKQAVAPLDSDTILWLRDQAEARIEADAVACSRSIKA